MAGVDYSVASYVTHVISGLPLGYNLMRRMLTIPNTRETLNEDSLSSHIIQDEFMQEPERPAKDTDYGKSAKGGDRGGGGSRREGRRCYICDAPDHLLYDCPNRDESDDDRDANRRKGAGGRRRRDNQPCKEKHASKTSSTKDADFSGGNARGEEASCSMVAMVEPTILLALEASEDFKAAAATVQANPTVVLLNSGCSHHLMGTKEAFVDMQPSGNVRHVCNFNGALQSVEGRGTIALQGEAGKQVLVPDVLYVPGVHANLLSAGQLKENDVKLQDDDGEMLLVPSAGEVLGQACYFGRVLCTNLCPFSTKSTTTPTEVVALRTIASATKSTPDMWARSACAHWRRHNQELGEA
ncbi:unnamed protein product [Closterium sp. NIES-54]